MTVGLISYLQLNGHKSYNNIKISLADIPGEKKTSLMIYRVRSKRDEIMFIIN